MGRAHEPAQDDDAARRRLIAERTCLRPVPSVAEIRIHTAHPGTGLARFAVPGDGDEDVPPPYWAFPWAGGAALARHVLDRPETVRGRRVLDLGAGSGLVGIAAGLAGAATVFAAECDPYGLAALALNADANGVVLHALPGDALAGPPPPVDLVLAGDVFYAAGLAARSLGFLDACLGAGIEVLIGDPGRPHLPRGRLRLVAAYDVPDFGEGAGPPRAPGAVYALVPAGSGPVPVDLAPASPF